MKTKARNKMQRIEKLKAEYKKEAKKADQRLVRLEQRATKTDRALGKYAYEYAYQHTGTNKQGKPRFNRQLPDNEAVIKSKLREVKSFNEMKSSQISQIRKVNKQRAATLNKNLGTDFSSEDLSNFWESKAFEELKKNGYDSEQILKIFSEYKENNLITKEKVDDFLTDNPFTDEVQEVVFENISKLGLTLKDFE